MVDPIRRKLLETGAAMPARMAATPSVFARDPDPLSLIAGGALAAHIEGLRAGNPFHAITYSRESSAAYTLTCATQPVSPPARSRSTGRGMPTTTISV